MINIDETDKKLIPHYVDEWLDINCKRYFIKRQRTRLDYSEIIAEKIAAKLGIISAHYEGIRMGHKLFLLSEDLANIGVFKPILDFDIQNTSLYTFWHLFERIYPDYSKQLLDELIKVFLMDIIIMNPDRNPTNWGIIIASSEPHICILDNELLLRGTNVKITSDFIEGDYLNGFEKKPDLIDELDCFLENSSDEYLLLFQQMLDTINPEAFEIILKEIETEYQDIITEKRWAVAAFSKNHSELAAMLDTHLKRYQR